jgi:hypothetical protein
MNRAVFIGFINFEFFLYSSLIYHVISQKTALHTSYTRKFEGVHGKD